VLEEGAMLERPAARTDAVVVEHDSGLGVGRVNATFAVMHVDAPSESDL
jgi:hypothetical protein